MARRGASAVWAVIATWRVSKVIRKKCWRQEPCAHHKVGPFSDVYMHECSTFTPIWNARGVPQHQCPPNRRTLLPGSPFVARGAFSCSQNSLACSFTPDAFSDCRLPKRLYRTPCCMVIQNNQSDYEKQRSCYRGHPASQT